MVQVTYASDTDITVYVAITGAPVGMRARWRFKSWGTRVMGIRDVAVVDAMDAVVHTLSADTGSVWEPVIQLAHQDDTFNPAVDNFLGFAHNPNALAVEGRCFSVTRDNLNVPVGTTVASATTVTLDQNVDLNTPINPGYPKSGSPAGARSTRHSFTNDTLRLTSVVHLNARMQGRVCYGGAQITGTSLAVGGLNSITFGTRPAFSFTGASRNSFENDPVQGASVVLRSTAHRFALRAVLPTGAPANDVATGRAKWGDTGVERAFVLYSQASGVGKFYWALQSGPAKPLTSYTSIVDMAVIYE